jgi:hypothetical protein
MMIDRATGVLDPLPQALSSKKARAAKKNGRRVIISSLGNDKGGRRFCQQKNAALG